MKKYKKQIYEENPDISKSNATELAREMYRTNKDSNEQKELYSSLVEQFKSSTETKINSHDKEDKIVFVSGKENASDDEDEIQPIKKKNTKKSNNKKKGKMKKNYSSSKGSSSDDSSDDESINLSKIKTNSSDDSSSDDDV